MPNSSKFQNTPGTPNTIRWIAVVAVMLVCGDLSVRSAVNGEWHRRNSAHRQPESPVTQGTDDAGKPSPLAYDLNQRSEFVNDDSKIDQVVGMRLNIGIPNAPPL